MANVETVLRALFTEALSFCQSSLKGERGLVVYQGCGAVHGLDAPTLWLTGAISTSLLQSLLEEKEPMFMIDAAEDSRTCNQTSAILSSLRSVLYVPLLDLSGKVVGLLYTDHRKRAGAFDKELLGVASAYVNDILSPQLLGACQTKPDQQELDWDSLTATRWL